MESRPQREASEFTETERGDDSRSKEKTGRAREGEGIGDGGIRHLYAPLRKGHRTAYQMNLSNFDTRKCQIVLYKRTWTIWPSMISSKKFLTSLHSTSGQAPKIPLSIHVHSFYPSQSGSNCSPGKRRQHRQATHMHRCIRPYNGKPQFLGLSQSGRGA